MSSELQRSVDAGEATFPSWDGVPLFYRKWVPAAGAQRGVVVFHRGHEHSGRVAPFAEALSDGQTAVFAWDVRGQGRSERGTHPVRLQDLVRDVDAFVRHIGDTYGLTAEQLCIVSHSLSSVFVCTWIHDYAPPLRGLVLITPGFRVKLRVPFALEMLRLWTRFVNPDLTVRSLVKGRMLTSVAAEAEAYDHDPLIKREVRARLLIEMAIASRRVVDDAAAITTPTMVITAGRDRVVEAGLQHKFSSGLSSSRKSHHQLPNALHDPLHDVGREEVYERVRKFIDECFSRPVEDEEAMQRAEDSSWTALEEWREGGPQHVLLRVFLKTVGRMSNGIRLGLQRGFDSGVSLDYAYRNEAHGLTPVGRWLDRIYLSAVGWRAMRKRRDHLQQLIEVALAMVAREGLPARLLDVASGPGRYLLEVLKKHPEAEGWMVDLAEANVTRGCELAARLGVTTAHFSRGNAFDADALAGFTPPPSIGIVSGLYEVFPRNNVVYDSLLGLARAIPTGGLLLYTNQPWHPHLRFISNVLPNRFGRPWRMRCRSQMEMDHLVALAGFEKLTTRVDEWGIFSVSLARRVADPA